MGKNNIKIEIDDLSGFCFGVVNAIARAQESISGGEEVYSLGDIVHNHMEVKRLEGLGLKTIMHDDMDSIRGRTLLIRAHGEPPSTYARAAELGISVIDATCPVVARLQKRVAEADRLMSTQGGQVVILGKRGHAEVVGLTGQTNGRAIVIEGVEDLDKVDFGRPIFFMSQTTQSLALFGQIKDEMLRRAANPAQVTVLDTICRQVANREAHLADFARRFDVVLFVSGRKSSNGKVLLEVCREANPNCFAVESPDEIMHGWLSGCGSVGICGATSTPKWLMEKVAERVEEISQNRPKT